MKSQFLKRCDQYLKILSIYDMNYAKRTRRLANALAVTICIMLVLAVAFSIPHLIFLMFIPIAIMVSYTVSKLVVNSRLKRFSQNLQMDALFHIARITALGKYSIKDLLDNPIIPIRLRSYISLGFTPKILKIFSDRFKALDIEDAVSWFISAYDGELQAKDLNLVRRRIENKLVERTKERISKITLYLTVITTLNFTVPIILLLCMLLGLLHNVLYLVVIFILILLELLFLTFFMR